MSLFHVMSAFSPDSLITRPVDRGSPPGLIGQIRDSKSPMTSFSLIDYAFSSIGLETVDTQKLPGTVPPQLPTLTSAALRRRFIRAAAVSPSLSSIPSTKMALTSCRSRSLKDENIPRAMSAVSGPRLES